MSFGINAVIVKSLKVCVCFLRWAPVRVHLARLWQEVLPVRRADTSLPHTHGREALQLSNVWQVLHEEWPPDETRPATRRLPSQHAPGHRCSQETPLLLLHVVLWFWRPKSDRSVRHTHLLYLYSLDTCSRHSDIHTDGHRHLSGVHLYTNPVKSDILTSQTTIRTFVTLCKQQIEPYFWTWLYSN